VGTTNNLFDFRTTSMGVSKGASCAKIWQALTMQKTAQCSKNAVFSTEPKMSH